MHPDIRGIDPDQLPDFVRAVPGMAGLPTWEPEPAAWWAGPGIGSKFGGRPGEEDVERAVARATDVERIRVAMDGGKIVGTSQMLSLEVTIPGAGPVPMGGLTAVGVAATHRRRGLLRAMMRELLDDCRQRGEVLATLCASEGSIYGRYGFGPATFQIRWELDRHRATWARRTGPVGRMELVDATTGAAAWTALHDRIRATRIGEVSAYPGYFTDLAGPADQGHDGTGAKQYVLHYDTTDTIDGAAIYRTPWSPDKSTAGTVAVDWLEATTPAAYTDLWTLLTDIDLTKRVIAARRPVDEALRWQLADQRSLRITAHSDNLWVRLIDVPAALTKRAYTVDGSLVLDVTDDFCPQNTGRWHLHGGPQGATCDSTSAPADLVLDAAALGSLYLGGLAPGPLARAGLITELTPGALSRVTTMLTGTQAPHTACGF